MGRYAVAWVSRLLCMWGNRPLIVFGDHIPVCGGEYLYTYLPSPLPDGSPPDGSSSEVFPTAIYSHPQPPYASYRMHEMLLWLPHLLRSD